MDDKLDEPPKAPSGSLAAAESMVRALGVMGATLGILGIALLPLGLASFSKGDEGSSAATMTAATWWLYISAVLGTGLSVLLLVAGVGSMSFKKWARPAMLLFAIISVLFGIVAAYFFYKWIVPWDFAETAQAHKTVITFFPLFGWLLAMPYAIWVLVYFSRRRVKELFNMNMPHGGNA